MAVASGREERDDEHSLLEAVLFDAVRTFLLGPLGRLHPAGPPVAVIGDARDFGRNQNDQPQLGVASSCFSRNKNLDAGLAALADCVALDEVPGMLRHWGAHDVAASLDHLCDVLGNVVSPVLKCVEGYDANWVVKLPRQKIIDNSFKIGSLNLGLAVDATATEAIND